MQLTRTDQNSTELRTDREPLAVAFGCEKFHRYMYDKTGRGKNRPPTSPVNHQQAVATGTSEITALLAGTTEVRPASDVQTKK